MDRVAREELLSKPEMQDAVEALREQLGRIVPPGSFAEREATMLVVIGEAGRRFLEQDLRASASGLPPRVLVVAAQAG